MSVHVGHIIAKSGQRQDDAGIFRGLCPVKLLVFVDVLPDKLHNFLVVGIFIGHFSACPCKTHGDPLAADGINSQAVSLYKAFQVISGGAVNFLKVIGRRRLFQHLQGLLCRFQYGQILHQRLLGSGKCIVGCPGLPDLFPAGKGDSADGGDLFFHRLRCLFVGSGFYQLGIRLFCRGERVVVGNFFLLALVQFVISGTGRCDRIPAFLRDCADGVDEIHNFLDLHIIRVANIRTKLASILPLDDVAVLDFKLGGTHIDKHIVLGDHPAGACACVELTHRIVGHAVYLKVVDRAHIKVLIQSAGVAHAHTKVLQQALGNVGNALALLEGNFDGGNDVAQRLGELKTGFALHTDAVIHNADGHIAGDLRFFQTEVILRLFHLGTLRDGHGDGMGSAQFAVGCGKHQGISANTGGGKLVSHRGIFRLFSVYGNGKGHGIAVGIHKQGVRVDGKLLVCVNAAFRYRIIADNGRGVGIGLAAGCYCDLRQDAAGMVGSLVATGGAAAVGNVPVTVATVKELGQTHNAQADIAIGQSDRAAVFRHHYVNIVGGGDEIILHTNAINGSAVAGVVQVLAAVTVGVATVAGVIVTCHLGNGVMQTHQADPDGLPCLHDAVAVALAGDLCKLYFDLVAPDDLVSRSGGGRDPEDIVSGQDPGGIDTACAGEHIPGRALVVADRHFGNGGGRGGREVQLTAVSGKVQGIELCVPLFLIIGVIGNIFAAGRTDAGKAVNAELHGSIVAAAYLHHHKTGAGRIGRTVNAVVVGIAGGRNIDGIVGHFDDRNAFLQGGQGHPVALAGRIGILGGQLHHIVSGENGVGKVGSNDVVIKALGNDLPDAVGFQGLGLTHIQAQVVAAVDIQQHAILRNAAVLRAGGRVVIQAVIGGFVVVGVGNGQILLIPCQPAGFGDLALHSNTVDICRTVGCRIGNELECGGAVAVIGNDLCINIRIAVILVVLVNIYRCAGGHSNGQGILEPQLHSHSVSTFAGSQSFCLCHGRQGCVAGHCSEHILRAAYQQPAVFSGCGGVFAVRSGVGACSCRICVVHHGHLHLTQGNRAILFHRERHTAPTLSPDTEHGCIDGIAYGVGGHTLRGLALDRIHRRALTVDTVFKAGGDPEAGGQVLGHRHGHRIGLLYIFHR